MLKNIIFYKYRASISLIFILSLFAFLNVDKLSKYLILSLMIIFTSFIYESASYKKFKEKSFYRFPLFIIINIYVVIYFYIM